MNLLNVFNMNTLVTFYTFCLSSQTISGFVHLIDHGDIRGPGRMTPSSAFKWLVPWRGNGRTMLAGSRTFIHWVGDSVIPQSLFLCVLVLDAEPLGHKTCLFSYFALFPCYHPLLVGPKSHLSSHSDVVSEVLLF